MADPKKEGNLRYIEECLDQLEIEIRGKVAGGEKGIKTSIRFLSEN